MGLDNIEVNLADIRFKKRKYNIDDVKEKIQNAQIRLKEQSRKPVGSFKEVDLIIDKIFKEEFGKELL